MALSLSSLPTPLILVFLCSLPVVSANAGAATVNDVGFYLGFVLLVGVSAVEAALSMIWMRLRVIAEHGLDPEVSLRACGREIYVQAVDFETAEKIAEESSLGCGCFRKRTQAYGGKLESVLDHFGGISMVPTLLIRRFNPTTSLEAPAGLVSNIKYFFSPNERATQGKGKVHKVARVLERTVHLIIGLTDLSLGIAGLALNSRSPQQLWETLKDPKAPITFDNYSTLFLLWWLLGVVLLICMIPLKSRKISVQIFGFPAMLLFLVASLASLGLFCVGCWKIDYARRHHLSWTPMLSYWIGGASAVGVDLCGIMPFHIFGVIGLVFMLKHTF